MAESSGIDFKPNSTAVRMTQRPARLTAAPAIPDNAEDWDHFGLAQEARGLYLGAVWIAAAYALGGSFYMLQKEPNHTLAFAVIAGTGWAGLQFWRQFGRRGVPAFPVLVVLWNLLNSLPLLNGNATLEGVPNSTINACAWTVALFLLTLAVGWIVGVQSSESRRSVWNIMPGGAATGTGGALVLSLPLLALSIAYQMSLITGLFFHLIPGSMASLMSVFTAFSGAVVSLGAMLGGMAVARRRFDAGTALFWVLFASLFFLFTSGILLSGANALVIACAIGLGFGHKRIPWKFLVGTLLVVGFLNQGKFVMRERYWNEDSGSARVGLAQLPQFYAEWAQASLDVLGGNLFGGQTQPNVDLGEQHSIVDRLDNFQNLTFIVGVLESGNVQPLYGKTYSLIPALLIPRLLWPDKPRTHEGQILLNLNFGRQATEEDTERTYVAWGLLPEAVGNFGCIWGAVLLGLFAGFGTGWLETWSGRKQLLSAEGLVATALLVQIGISYEMVASVFVTSTFQMMVAVIVVSLCLRSYFMGRVNPVRRRPPVSETRQIATVGAPTTDVLPHRP